MSERYLTLAIKDDHTEPAIAAGMWIGLWIGELLVAAEYWLARAAHGFRRHVLAFACIALGGTDAFVLHEMTAGDSGARVATLDLKALANGVELYRSERGYLPARLEDLVPKYLLQLHADPWGHNYVLYRGAGGAAIASAGPDGVLGTRDDIVNVLPHEVKQCPVDCPNTLRGDGTLEALGCPRITFAREGIRIADLRPGALTVSGIRIGDLVTAVNNNRLTTPEAVLEAYGKIRDAKRFEIDLVRDNRPVHITVDRDWAQARIRTL